MSFDCPECGRPLLTSQAGRERVDGCHACGGVWFDDGELGRLMATAAELANLERAYLPEADHASLGSGCCPRCGEALAWHSLRQAKDVRMRVCGKCRGVWAPEGTLVRLAGALGAGPVAVQPEQVDEFHLSAVGLLLAWVVPFVSVPLLVAIGDVDGRLVPALGGAGAAWLYLLLVTAALVALKPHTVWVSRQGLRLRNALFGWRVPWACVRSAELHEPDEYERFDDDEYVAVPGRVERLGQLSLADLAPDGDWTPSHWRITGTTRLWVLSSRGWYTLGAEWRDHERLILAMRRAMARR